MKRLMIRLAVLSVVVALGLIAIAQARFGWDSTLPQVDANADPEAASSPSPAPGPIGTPPMELPNLVGEPIPRMPMSSDSNVSFASATSDTDLPDARLLAQNTVNTNSDIPNFTSDSTPTDASILQPTAASTPGVPASTSGAISNPYRDDTTSSARYDTPSTQATTPPASMTPSEPPIRGEGRQLDHTIGVIPTGLPGYQPELTTDSTNALPPDNPTSSRQDAGAMISQPDTAVGSSLNLPLSSPGSSDYPTTTPSTAASDNGYSYGNEPARLSSPGDEYSGTSSLGGARDSLMNAEPLSSSMDNPTKEGSGRPGSKDLEGPQSPVLTVQKTAPDAVQVGKECVFKITVRNDGAVPAHQVRIIDSIPEGTEFVSSTPQASQSGVGQLVWQRDSLEPGEEVSIELHLMPLSEGELGSVARVEFETRASARVVATKPELSLQLTAPKTVMIGSEASIQIEISNPGTGPATGVMLLENVPAGLRHASGQALEFEVGDLAPGESRELELILTAEQAGRVTNVISAKAEANLQVEGTVELEVVAPALKVALDGPSVRYLERQAVYTVAINNPGTASAEDVELITHLPQGMKFVQANNHGHYDSATHAVYWGLEELPANETGTVELTTMPVEAGEQTLRVEGRAASGLADEARQTVSVQGLVAIRFEVVDVQDPIEVGGETTYEIRVVNQGTKAATNVQVAAVLPPGLKPITGDGPSRFDVKGNQVVFEPLRKLAPKADTTYHVKVQGVQAGDQRIRVQIVTDEVTTPITKEESTQVYGDQ